MWCDVSVSDLKTKKLSLICDAIVCSTSLRSLGFELT